MIYRYVLTVRAARKGNLADRHLETRMRIIWSTFLFSNRARRRPVWRVASLTRHPPLWPAIDTRVALDREVNTTHAHAERQSRGSAGENSNPVVDRGTRERKPRRLVTERFPKPFAFFGTAASRTKSHLPPQP